MVTLDEAKIRRLPRPEGVGVQRLLDGVVRGFILLVVVTVVVLNRVNESGNHNVDSIGADPLALLVTDSALHQNERQPMASPVAAQAIKPSRPVRRGEDNAHVPVPEAPRLSAAELAAFKPNELGYVPVLMYHAFTTDPEHLDDWTTNPERFRDDLQWLADHDFFIISLDDLLTNEIAVPPGKHPVVLTFDDASSGQFRLLEDATGQLAPDPATAVGVMEAFFATHPDIGRGGHFAFVPNNCFHHDAEVTTCEERLAWLAGHGYEIGNHTWYHQNLGEADDERFMSQIGDTKLWIDERVPGDANLSNVLTLPFGAFPATEWQYHMLVNGFDWEGQRIQLAAVLTVGGGPSVSPDSAMWDPWAITRINTGEATLGYWQAQIETGATTLYTSDGNPTVTTIPEALPEDLAAQFDPSVIAGKGRSLVGYNAEPADETTGLHQGDMAALVRSWTSARRKRASRVRPSKVPRPRAGNVR